MRTVEPTEDEAYDDWRDNHPEEAMKPWRLEDDLKRRRRWTAVAIFTVTVVVCFVLP